MLGYAPVSIAGQNSDHRVGALRLAASQQRTQGPSWLSGRVIACLAHNLHRWTELLGLPRQHPQARSHRSGRLLDMPGRLTRHARNHHTAAARPRACQTDDTGCAGGIRARLTPRARRRRSAAQAMST